MGKKYCDPLIGRYRGNSPLHTLKVLFGPERKNLLLSMLFGTMKHCPVFIMPLITGAIINQLAYPGPDSVMKLLQYAGIITIILLQNLPNNYMHVKFLSRSIRNVEARLRSALVRRLQELSISFHDNFEKGRLHSKILRDADSVVMLSNQFLGSVFLSMVTMLVALGVTIYKDPVVALFFVIAVPLAVGLVRIFRDRIRESNRQLRYAIEAMSALVSEIVTLVPVTRAHALEDKEIGRMNHQVHKVKKKGIKVDMVNAIFHSAVWITFQLAQKSCLLFTGYLAIKGRMSVGHVVMYQTFFQQVLGGVNLLLNMYPQVARGFESIQSMGEILECPDLERNRGKKTVTEVEGAFRFEKVRLTYPETYKPAVTDFSLDVKPGECIAFVGESGSGKTSVMSMLTGFHRPTEGQILLDGQDMQELDLRTFRQFLAVVPQQTILFSGTLRDNITYGLDNVKEEKLRDIIDRANLTDVVAKLPNGLETMIGENGAKLSGGQRQRVAIARALIRDPKVIILDEATSALDVASERSVQQAIERLIEGRTTFIVAHRLSTIRNADRIIVMDDGRQIEEGSHEFLLDLGGKFHRYAALQA